MLILIIHLKLNGVTISWSFHRQKTIHSVLNQLNRDVLIIESVERSVAVPKQHRLHPVDALEGNHSPNNLCVCVLGEPTQIRKIIMMVWCLKTNSR